MNKTCKITNSLSSSFLNLQLVISHSMFRAGLNKLSYYKVNILFPTFFGSIIYFDWSYTQKSKARLRAKQLSNQPVIN